MYGFKDFLNYVSHKPLFFLKFPKTTPTAKKPLYGILRIENNFTESLGVHILGFQLKQLSTSLAHLNATEAGLLVWDTLDILFLLNLFNDCVLAAIEELPLVNVPGVFGLHPNAEIGYYTQAAREMWLHLIELQPHSGKYKLCNLFRRERGQLVRRVE